MLNKLLCYTLQCPCWLLAKFLFSAWSFKLLQQVYSSFSLQKFSNGTKGKVENYVSYKYFQGPRLNWGPNGKKKWNPAWEFNMKPPSPQTATTFFSGWRRQAAAADGSPAPIVAKELSRSNVLGSYACIHTLPTYHPISAFHFFPFLVHPAILIRNLWLRRPQENNWKILDAKLFNASVTENLFEPLPQSTY